jgi:hypothetical protein
MVQPPDEHCHLGKQGGLLGQLLRFDSGAKMAGGLAWYGPLAPVAKPRNYSYFCGTGRTILGGERGAFSTLEARAIVSSTIAVLTAGIFGNNTWPGEQAVRRAVEFATSKKAELYKVSELRFGNA